ncbi:MAG: hypothetical protein ACI4JC_11420, partial [Faecalibacterium sp.]
ANKNFGLCACTGRLKSFFGSFFSKKEQKPPHNKPLLPKLCLSIDTPGVSYYNRPVARKKYFSAGNKGFAERQTI